MGVKTKRKVLDIGDTVLEDKYEITKVIHTSGMANVYLVSDNRLGKSWCLKEIVKSEAGKNMVEYTSLLREANIMKNLNHMNIPRIVTMEEEGDSIFIVMDYVNGLSIKDFLQLKGAIDQTIVVKWMKQVCGVLIYLHSRENPIIYRDLKPDNIMIQEDGSIKVLDFGISDIITEKNYTISEALGSKGYAAPEQKIVGSRYDLRSDIYAFGRTMYHMLTGLRPSNEKGEFSSIRKVNSSLSVGLDEIIEKCTKDNPDERYQTMEEVLYALSNYEKLDDSYRKVVKKKIGLCFSLIGVSIFIFILSLAPYNIYFTGVNKNYLKYTEYAKISNPVDNYIEAIKYKPLDIKTYITLIDSIKSDGVFSKDEESKLLGTVKNNLKKLKKEKEYSKLAFNLGKLYLFYYEGDEGGTLSSDWFRDALLEGYNIKEVLVYYNLVNFKNNISLAIAESSYSGMYKEYWDNLDMVGNYNSGDVVTLKVNTLRLEFLNEHLDGLLSDGVSESEIKSKVAIICDFLASSDNYDSSRLVELNTNLKEKASYLY